MNKIYQIINEWRDNCNKFNKISIILFLYTHSLNDYKTTYTYKKVLNKQANKNELFEYAI